MEFKEGDTLRPKPKDPPTCKVITVYFNGQKYRWLVEWASGMRAVVTRPNELELVERAD